MRELAEPFDVSLMAIPKHPTWSPDGTQVVFYSDEGGYGDLYVADRNGRGKRRFLRDEPPASDSTDNAEPPAGGATAVDATVFAKGYIGRGYYNIRFDQWVALFQIGLSIDFSSWSPVG